MAGKRMSKAAAMGACFAVGMLASQGALACERTMQVAIGEWPPFVSEDLQHYGLAARIVTEAFAKEDIDVEYRFYPWKRAYFEVLQGDQDATAIWSRTSEREEEVLYSEPVLTTDKVFFHLDDTSFDWEDIDDLEGYTIGATNGYAYGEAFAEAEEQGRIDVEYANSDKQNIEKLIRGRIDLFVVEEPVGHSILNTDFEPEAVEDVVQHPRALQETKYHLLFSQAIDDGEKLLESFNRGLESLREDGRIDRYVEASQGGEYIR